MLVSKHNVSLKNMTVYLSLKSLALSRLACICVWGVMAQIE